MNWLSLLGSVVGGAIVGQICFAYGKRVERRVVVDYLRYWMLSPDRVVNRINAREHWRYRSGKHFRGAGQ